MKPRNAKARDLGEESASAPEAKRCSRGLAGCSPFVRGVMAMGSKRERGFFSELTARDMRSRRHASSVTISRNPDDMSIRCTCCRFACRPGGRRRVTSRSIFRLPAASRSWLPHLCRRGPCILGARPHQEFRLVTFLFFLPACRAPFVRRMTELSKVESSPIQVAACRRGSVIHSSVASCDVCLGPLAARMWSFYFL
jgi:hypothetical protein